MHLKKILLFVLLPTLSFAQFNRGQVFTNGLLSLTRGYQTPLSPSVTAEATTINFSMTSGWGVFINSKVAIGSGVGYSRYSLEGNNVSGTWNTKRNSYSANLFLRRYYKITEAFYFALQAKAEYAAGNETDYQNSGGFITTSTSKSHDASLNVTPYFVFFPSKTWALEVGIGSLGYSSYISPSSVYKGNSFGLSFGTFSFGLGYYFKRKE